MKNLATIQDKDEKIEAILNSDVASLSYEEIEESISFLRVEANRLIASITREAANDRLENVQNVLETPYSSGLAKRAMALLSRRTESLIC